MQIKIKGHRQNSTKAVLPTENDNWRKASINGIDSMSPKTQMKQYHL